MRSLPLLVCLLLVACGTDEPEPAPGPAAQAAETVGALPPAAPATGGVTVVDRAGERADLATFASALRASGLADSLAAEGPFTVFAPSDDAFDALPDGALDALLADDEALRTALLAHVLPFRMPSVDLDLEQTVETLGGTDLTIVPTSTGATLRAGGASATVTAPDLDAPNGVLHVIDTVLAP